MKIAVGTISPQKLQFLKEVLNDLYITYSLEPINVLSEISNQPISSKETKQGSINRAKNALIKSKKAVFSLGIEVGYDLNHQDDYEMFCWVTIVDNKGKQISACSHKLLLLVFHQKILKGNKYLGEFVRQYLEENSGELEQHIGIIIKDRKPFIQTTIKSAIFNYFIK